MKNMNCKIKNLSKLERFVYDNSARCDSALASELNRSGEEISAAYARACSKIKHNLMAIYWARQEAHDIWSAAAKHDNIAPGGMFVVFSGDNPHIPVMDAVNKNLNALLKFAAELPR
jgi:hypothetical protein